MKQIWVFLVLFLLPAILAQQQKGQEIAQTKVDSTKVIEKINTTRIEKTPQEIQERNQEEIRERVQLQEKVKNITDQVRARIEEETRNIKGAEQKVYQNQNTVRVAVHTLLAMEDLTGGIGKNISQIAREFNNSIQATIRAEERIEKRNKITRFFVGGDDQAAKEIEQQVLQNQIRIQELKKYSRECNCSEEIKAMLQEQIQNLEREQSRLSELVKKEKESKGLFGWIWKK
ncbi:MAG: hypothetical protein KQA41_00715 [Candidatus Aenigmarchaeota archaeon]|nr:hypothetical protein [Candidatus Aenigmarchaeota archaeon]MBU5688738.1 hypothetical protein [Candidatus Aenigmarchaeota archaeon]